MTQFNTVKLAGQRVLVEGTDFRGSVGSTVVCSAEWDHINSHGQFDAAEAAFNDSVEAFFAPLTEAADALDEARRVPSEDSATYVVLQEEVPATAGQEGIVALLSRDSVILRLIEEGNHDRLVWVGNDLEVVAAANTFPGAGEEGVADDASQPSESVTENLGGLVD